jgi:hypothetical protein
VGEHVWVQLRYFVGCFLQSRMSVSAAFVALKLVSQSEPASTWKDKRERRNGVVPS